MFSANSSQVSDSKLFVEDVFSTYLYTGTSGSQTITNGIDLAGKGGLVWQKRRDAATDHYLFDTARGGVVSLASNSTSTGTNWGAFGLTYNSNGFTILSGFSTSATFASWTFREAPKFFDIVTWTGDGVENRAIPHALGSQPGFILLKATSQTSGWDAWHRSSSFYLGTAASVFCMGRLNETTAFSGGYSEAQRFGAAPTSTNFTLGPNINGAPLWNASGVTYVAYLYAHDATADGIIQCGSYTGNGAAEGPTVTLGWEPQWVIVKNASASSVWMVVDNMRGMTADGNCGRLDANQAFEESATTGFPLAPNATGFQVKGATALNGSGQTSIYIAIRRGPMRTPTLGTSVFAPFATSLAVDTAITTNFPVDLMISGQRNSNNATDNWAFIDRLRGATASNNTSSTPQKRLRSTSTSAEDNPTYPYAYNWWNTGLVQGYGLAGASQIYYTLRRAPGFFDEVCYTTSNAGPNFGSNQRVSHNLAVAPELVIHKQRGVVGDWLVYAGPEGVSKFARLNTTDSFASATNIWGTAPTATDFGVNVGATFGTGFSMVAYLFASCPGVSKVGSYTGNGSSQTINCGFAAGARFVMIKRTNAAGDWYVWDTARGVVAANDPHLSLNDISAEVTTDDSVDTASSGFVVNQVAATNVNVNAATYIYLAIA